MGSVLLNRGGAGGASSYGSVGEYTETTGVNPYSMGRGLGSISKKLESLSIAPKKRKEKNINFNL
jgi:hypothetical protein